MNISHLNNWAWLLIALGIFNIWLYPFVWGKARRPWGISTLISELLTFLLILAALKVI